MTALFLTKRHYKTQNNLLTKSVEFSTIIPATADITAMANLSHHTKGLRSSFMGLRC